MPCRTCSAESCTYWSSSRSSRSFNSGSMRWIVSRCSWYVLYSLFIRLEIALLWISPRVCTLALFQASLLISGIFLTQFLFLFLCYLVLSLIRLFIPHLVSVFLSFRVGSRLYSWYSILFFHPTTFMCERCSYCHTCVNICPLEAC